MKSIEFNVRVITPMFMAGADRNTPELRPSEFKGMMRFWWRAARAENDIKKLKKEEAEIFGGTGRKEGRSKFIIKLTSIKLTKGTYWPLPHKKNFKNKCFLPDSEFKIELIINDEHFYDLVINVFFLSVILGGLGKRSRRGFGSVKVISNYKIDPNFLIILLNKINNTYQVKDNIIRNISRGGDYPWIRQIEIGKSYSSFNELLETIGHASHNYKNPALGNAKPRMASPIYVSVIENDKNFIPIITTLNSYFPSGYPRWNFRKQNDFKKEIL